MLCRATGHKGFGQVAEWRIDVHDQSARATAVADAPARVDDGDPHDVAGLYVRHRSAFTAQARRALRDQRDVDEVVKEAFLRMFLALPELETESQAVAYGRRTITNLCIDRYRAQARRPTLVDLDSIAPEDAVEADPGDPVVRAEDAAVVRQALEMLSPLHRQALVKREIEEKSLPVIADELGIAEDSVKHLLYRSRRALPRLLVGTSVAPGADGDGARRTAPRIGSRGVATVLALLLLGLGSGPDLEAVPVVGVDLPDLIGVTEVARTVGDVVTGVVNAVTLGGTTDATGAGRAVDGSVERPGAAGSGPGGGAEAPGGGLQDAAAGQVVQPGTPADGAADGGAERLAADGAVADDGAAGGVAARGVPAGGANAVDQLAGRGGPAEDVPSARTSGGSVVGAAPAQAIEQPPQSGRSARGAERSAADPAPRSPRAGGAAGDADTPAIAVRPQPASSAEQRGGRPQDTGRSAAAPAASRPGSPGGQPGAGHRNAKAADLPGLAAAPPAARGPERAAAVSSGAAAVGSRAASRGPADRSADESGKARGRGRGQHDERAAARAAGAGPSAVVPTAAVPPVTSVPPVRPVRPVRPVPTANAPAPVVANPVATAPVVTELVAPAPLVPESSAPAAP
ncbi:hypothetical protein BH24ACT10_BH24ACT10_01550 [soil metagenome]